MYNPCEFHQDIKKDWLADEITFPTISTIYNRFSTLQDMHYNIRILDTVLYYIEQNKPSNLQPFIVKLLDHSMHNLKYVPTKYQTQDALLKGWEVIKQREKLTQTPALTTVQYIDLLKEYFIKYIKDEELRILMSIILATD